MFHIVVRRTLQFQVHIRNGNVSGSQMSSFLPFVKPNKAQYPKICCVLYLGVDGKNCTSLKRITFYAQACKTWCLSFMHKLNKFIFRYLCHARFTSISKITSLYCKHSFVISAGLSDILMFYILPFSLSRILSEGKFPSVSSPINPLRCTEHDYTVILLRQITAELDISLNNK
jgi:hypothetical protein